LFCELLYERVDLRMIDNIDCGAEFFVAVLVMSGLANSVGELPGVPSFRPSRDELSAWAFYFFVKADVHKHLLVEVLLLLLVNELLGCCLYAKPF